MNITVREYRETDLESMIKIWNEVVEGGTAFPQLELLDSKTGKEFFVSQTCCAVAEDSEREKICGLYILHPNNVGRCGHICNASYAVLSCERGRGIGESLVSDCLERAKAKNFKILQFNAVVKTNTAARKLYEKLGFKMLGIIPGGFLMKDGHYEDICPYYHTL